MYHLAKFYCTPHEHVFGAYLERPEPESFSRWQKEVEQFQNPTGADPGVPPMPYITSYKLAGSVAGSDEWTTSKPTAF